jgi:ribosomal protein S27AE
MMDFGRDLLVRGIGAARANSWDEARFFLEKFLGTDPPVEMRVEAWRYLAEIAKSPEEKRDYISRILAYDPTDGFARRTLAVLDGRLDPAEIVDPDHIPPPADERATTVPERLVCPRCGSSELAASSDGQKLVCAHCQYEEPIPQTAGSQSSVEHDFAAAMWTAKGHRSDIATPVLVCDGCGASFLPAPGIHSLSCPFCGSVRVGSKAEPRERIAPDAIVPFGSALADVLHALKSETPGDPTSGPFAVYLPVWVFNFTGSVHWTGYKQEQHGYESRRKPASGDYTVIEQKTLVRATHALPESFGNLVDGFDLAALVPYDPRQLAGYLAATYDISLDEASMSARPRTFDALRQKVKQSLSEVLDLEMSFERMGTDSYQLLLLPFWSAQTGPENARRLLFINGQTGEIAPDNSSHGLLSWISRLLDLN